MFRFDAAAEPTRFGSVYELAKAQPLSVDSSGAVAFNRIFEIRGMEATCRAGEQLAKKYGVPEDNRQFVVSIRNRCSYEQTWFNTERKKKPQNFTAHSHQLLNSIAKGEGCDFCDAYNYTAVDDFGRIELSAVVSGSNLFKCCAPGHGVLVMKKHDPLDIELTDVRDLMKCGQEWLETSCTGHREKQYPLFVWNCLGRAGASQFHGHAQVMHSPVPFPCYEKLRAVQESYAALYSDGNYFDDLFGAYEELGLLFRMNRGAQECVVYPSLTPWKDMEVVLWASCMTNEAFTEALYLTLRTLMVDFGMKTFNVGIQGMSVSSQSTNAFRSPSVGNVMGRIVSRGKLTSQASDFGGLEVFGGASIGHTDPFEIYTALHRVFQEPREVLKL